MAQRQEAQREVVGGDGVESPAMDLDGGVEAAVGQYGAFGLAGGAGCVDEGGNVVGTSLGRAHGDGVAALRTGCLSKSQHI